MTNYVHPSAKPRAQPTFSKICTSVLQKPLQLKINKMNIYDVYVLILTQILGVSRAVQAQKISCIYFFSSYFCILVQQKHC